MISLTDILPAALTALDVQTRPSNLTIPKAKRVVVFLVDGLGFHNLALHSDLHPVATQILATAGKCSLPSTTPVSLASIGTGLNPGEHGFLSATMYLEDSQTILQPLKWEAQPNPKGFAPEPTQFEIAEKSYVEVNRIGPSAYENSGLTQAVLRGGNYLAAENLNEISAVVSKCLIKGFPSLTYVYYRELDRVGHVHGVDSDNWRNELKLVLNCIAEIQNSLSDDDQFIVTADHGMVDVSHRVWLEDESDIWSSTRLITGEPRFRNFYAESGKVKKLGQGLQKLTDIAKIFTREEFISSGLVGDVDEQFHSRIGDFVAIANSTNALCSRTVDLRTSNLIGNHGGNSDTERDIPISVLAR